MVRNHLKHKIKKKEQESKSNSHPIILGSRPNHTYKHLRHCSIL